MTNAKTLLRILVPVFIAFFLISPSAKGAIITTLKLLQDDPKTLIDIEYLAQRAEGGQIFLLEQGVNLLDSIKGTNEVLYLVGHGNEDGFAGYSISSLIQQLKAMKLTEAIQANKIESIYLLYCCGGSVNVHGESAVNELHQTFLVPVLGFPGNQALCRPSCDNPVTELNEAENWVSFRMNPGRSDTIVVNIVNDWKTYKDSLNWVQPISGIQIYANATQAYQHYKVQYLELINLNIKNPYEPPVIKK